MFYIWAKSQKRGWGLGHAKHFGAFFLGICEHLGVFKHWNKEL